MTRSTAAIYWAGTAAGYFEPMVLAYERGEVFPAPDQADLDRLDRHPPAGKPSQSSRAERSPVPSPHARPGHRASAR